MASVTFPDGTVIDSSGEIVGREAPAKLSSTEATQRAKTAEAPFTAGGLINQLKWGTNAALFALPDAAVSAFGRAAGLDEDEVFSFTKYFNRGEVAPQNIYERYARTISNAAAAGLPFTGALGLYSRGRALTAPLGADAGVLKRVAKDMLDAFRKNPKTVIAADLAFGGAYGGVEQLVEESMEEGPYKGLAKQTVPFATVLAVPTMTGMITKLAGISPTGQAIKAIRQVGADPESQLVKDIREDPILQDMMEERAFKFPGVNWAMKFARNTFAKQAARRVQEVTKDMTDPELTSVQDNLKRYNELVDMMRTDPILSQMNLADRFLLDSAQASLYGPLLGARNQVVNNLSGAALKREQLRQQDLENVFGDAFNALTPGNTALGPQMPFDQAVKVYITDYTNALNKTMKQIKGLTDDEALALSERVKPIDMFDAGDDLRNMLVAQMDGVALKFKMEFDSLIRGTDAAGVPIPQRVGMEVITTAPSRDFVNFAEGLLAKYRLTVNDRLYQMAGTPRSVKLTEFYYDRYLKALEKTERETIIPELVSEQANKAMQEQVKGTRSPSGALLSSQEELEQLQAEFLEKYMKAVNGLISGKMSREKAESLFELPKVGGKGKRAIDTERDINVKYQEKIKEEREKFSVGKEVLPTEQEIKQLRERARELAVKQVDFRLTAAEGLDLLSSAVTSRGQALMNYNRMVEMQVPEVTARQVLDKTNALTKDIEQFFVNSFGKDNPAVADFAKRYKAAFTDGYQKLFPLLVSKKAKTGEYLIPNEKVVQQALSSGENIRALRTIFGEDNQFFNKTLTDVMLDQAYKNKVIDPNTGLLDTNRYSAFLKTKSNLINQMPDTVQKNLTDELKIGEEVMQRVRDLEQRKADIEDVDFFRQLTGLAKVGRKGEVEFREGADPQRLIAQAISDPAMMRQLVDKFNKPAQIESLRRAVWRSVDDAIKNPDDPAYLRNFLMRNGKSLNMLYTPEHMNNLKFLADVQERVFAGVSAGGKLSPYMSTDEKLRQIIGAGFGTLESTARAAAIRQISYVHAGVNFMARMISRQQTNIYDAILYKALTDPEYAKVLANSTASVETPAGVKQMSRLAKMTGYYLPAIIKANAIEGVQALEQERELSYSPTPDIPQLPSGLRREIAPGSNLLPQNRVAPPQPPMPQPTQRIATLPKLPAPPDAQMYDRFAKLFPQDFASSVIQSRQP